MDAMELIEKSIVLKKEGGKGDNLRALWNT